MLPKYQVWEKGDETVILEENSIKNSGRYYVNVQGTQEIMDALKAKIETCVEKVYCEWATTKEDKNLLTVFQRIPGITEFQGTEILALIGESLGNLGYRERK